jgi:hypothetical protein
MNARPLFLIGLPRSGTTFLQKVLNAHPRILLTNETAVFLQIGNLISRSRKGVVEGIDFGKTYNKLWAEILHRRAGDLFKEFYKSIAEKEGKANLAYWGDKHPHYCNCMDFLWNLYPDALYLMSLRDPRDVACSIAKMNNVSLEQAIMNTSAFLSKYWDFFHRHKEVVPFLIYYERLIQNPRLVCEEILSFLRLDFTPEVEKALEVWTVRDAHTAPDKQKPRDFRENYGKWRKIFSSKELVLASKMFSPYLSLFGYPLELGSQFQIVS